MTSDSNNKSHAATRVASQAPTAFSMEAWVRTTSTSGGQIMGYGSSEDNQSWSRDRMVYMRNDGTLSFMLYPDRLTTVTTPKSYNDGQWHHIVASLSPTSGAMLYVVVEELIPEMSEGEHSDVGVISFAAGFSLMMMLDVALG